MIIEKYKELHPDDIEYSMITDIESLTKSGLFKGVRGKRVKKDPEQKKLKFDM
jgi:hypothetical protein